MAAVCRSKSKKPHYPASQICEDVEPDHQATVLTIPNFRTLPIEPRLKLADEDVIMEVDTAASVSLMPVEQWRSLQLPNPMERTKCVLRTYAGEVIPTHSKVLVEVEHMNQKKTIRVPLLIVGGTGPALLGRDCLNDTTGTISMLSLNSDQWQPSLQDILARHEAVFQPGLGTMKGMWASVHVTPGSTPKFLK